MTQLRWSPPAVRMLAVLRARSSYARLIDAPNAISALAADTMPGETVTGAVLLDQSFWADGPRFITGHLPTALSPVTGSPVNVDTLAFEAIEEATRERARKVGERHVLSALWKFTAASMPPGLNRDRLLARVRELELGSPFAPAEVSGRWHGLVDANAVIHYKDLHAIDWLQEAASPRVTVWLTSVLLDELDDLAFEAGPRSRARQRARVLNRWLRPNIQAALQPAGFEMRRAVTLRVWVPPLSAQPPDGQHLDAADELLDRGVPIHVVTNDNGMIARALVRGLEVLQLSPAALVDDGDSEPGAAPA